MMEESLAPAAETVTEVLDLSAKQLSQEQLIALLGAAKKVSERDWLLMLVTFWHGLSASEAVSLTPENFADGRLIVQRLQQGFASRLKGSRRTVQPLVEHKVELLNERAAVKSWLAAHADERRLFPISRIQFYRRVRHYGRAAGLPRHLCHPHVLKRLIAPAVRVSRLAMRSIREEPHRKHGPEKSPFRETKAFQIGEEIGLLVAAGMPRSKARKTVADKYGFVYDTVRRYDQEFLRHRASEGPTENGVRQPD